MLIKILPDQSTLVSITVLNAKISEVENKILNTSSLVTTTVLNTKIPDNSNYTITQEFNKFTSENLAETLKQADLVNKTDSDNKLTNFNKRITSNKTKNLEVQQKLNSLITKIYPFIR